MASRRTTNEDRRIGLLVRQRRLQLGLSQTDLANAIGVSFQQVQKYENGTNGIRGSRMVAVAHNLKVPATYFFPSDEPALPNEALAFAATSQGVAIILAWPKVPPKVRAAITALITESAA